MNIAQSISERIADILRMEIISAEIEPDASIKQSHIAERFNVSQAPVREALCQLTAERFLVHQANRGVRVAPLVAAEVLETAQLRITLESELVAAACKRFGVEDEKNVALALKKNAAARTVSELLKANDAFHEALYAPAGRPITLEIVCRLRARYARYLGFMWKHSGHAAASLKEHEELVALIRSARNADAAKLLRQHIQASTDAILTCLKNIEP
ncbi:MAG: GntR family transcriptional regulator [Rhodospirillales bacterium]